MGMLSCLLMFGCYYAYDIPAASNKQFQQHLNMTDTDFAWTLNAYYTSYSIPNIVLPPLAGLLMDQGHLRTMLVTLAALLCVGQMLFSLGVVWKWNWLALVGRLVFGIGGESLGVAQSRITTKWFGFLPVRDHLNLYEMADTATSTGVESSNGRDADVQGKHLALVMGLNLAIGRFGSVVNDFVSPWLVTRDEENVTRGVVYALWVGVLMCLVSLCAAGLLAVLDERMSGDDADNEKAIKAKDSSEELILIPDETGSPVDTVKPGSDGETIVPKLLKERKSWSLLVQEAARLPLAYWLICAVMILSYGTVIPFNTIHSAFLQTRFKMDPVSAAQVMAIPDTLSMFLTPFAGSFVDRYGFRVHVLGLCGALLTGVHLTLGLSSQLSWFIPYMPLSVLGFCYAFLLLFWPMMPLVVPHTVLATAFGLGSALLNLSLALFPLITAGFISADPTYVAVEVFFACCGIGCVLLCIWLNRVDYRVHARALRMPR